MAATLAPEPSAATAHDRVWAYFLYLVELGGLERYGAGWRTPERQARLDLELPVIRQADFHVGLIMLADMMAFCRREGIITGPGRGSVGGCYTAFLLGIHEADSIEWDLDFERFLNPSRVSFPDVDIDFSVRGRERVFDYVVNKYQRDGQVVLRVGAFRRASLRATVDAVAAAMSQHDPEAYAIATELKRCYPEGGIGIKVERELSWWLENGHGDKDRFREIATNAGWMEHLLALDGMFTNLTQHAAGVVILRVEDLPWLPQTSQDGEQMVTGYDMYALDALGYLKWDILGLRTLDICSDAHKFIGGDGSIRSLMKLWYENRDDPAVYNVLSDADTVGVFQMETPGYRRTLRAFRPEHFEHLMQLVALYRPGALDFADDQGRNMVEVFIERRHGREPAVLLHPSLKNALESTYGIMVYQEQQMRVARDFAGFSLAQADLLRKAIGKKLPAEMAKLKPLWDEGTKDKPKELADLVWKNVEAAAKYSWNRSHSFFYAVITWWTCFFKAHYPYAFYAALINSYEEDKEKQANVIAEARQHTSFRPPDINLAEDRFTVVEDDHDIVFGLNGIKGMGEANRSAILVDRALYGPFTSYEDFCRRLPSVPTNMKKSLVACGAFDSLGEDRVRLLASCPRGNQRWNTWLGCGCVSQKLTELAPGTAVKCATHKNTEVVSTAPIERKRWLVLEHMNALAKGDTKTPLTSPLEWELPSDADLATGEVEAMGYYISGVPLQDVSAELGRMASNVIGGEVASVKVHKDKRGDEMCTLTLTTPALTKKTVRVFSRHWPLAEPKVKKGVRLLFRGRDDGGTFLADVCWHVGDYRHFKHAKVWKDGEKPVSRRFDGTATMVQELEREGFRIRLL